MNEALDRVERATVRLTRLSGQGVLVPGNLILTAAHCIGWTSEGAMALGDHFVEEIESAGQKLYVAPLAVEPVSDVAVLGALDGQVFYDEDLAFEEFCEATPAVPLCTADFPLFEAFRVWVRSHEGKWIRGRGKQCNEWAYGLALAAEEQIQSGTSGGPVVNESGELVGLVSWASKGSSRTHDEDGLLVCDGSMPRAHRVVPPWLLEQMLGTREGR